ncbi:MAG: pentapeptide repeat-containing protein, partial [Cyanobacteria bacterium P01_E01_bin.34]
MATDFSGQNLRGRSFKGQNLQRANFCGADIRGANLSGADLTNADFRDAKAGLQRRWWLCLLTVCFVAVFSSSIFAAWSAGYLWQLISSSDVSDAWGGAIGLIFYLIYAIVAYRKGIISGLYVLLGTAAVAVFVAGAVA